MAEEDKNLFLSDNNAVSTTTTDSLKAKNSEKLFGLKDATTDMASSIKNLSTGVVSSIKDLFKSAADRNTNGDSSDFATMDVDIGNINKDAISNILTDTYNGDLWSAGVSAVNLYNVGTKWKINLDQHVDKDSYTFKYWYYVDNNQAPGISAAEDNDKVKVLDSIEDPTILSASFRLDPNSPLFSVTDTNGITAFINKYNKNHTEMAYATDYLNEFRESINKVFESPETTDNKTYRNTFFKNHYILKIDGLDKLDNLFVEYKSSEDRMFGTEQESLTFTLNEDVRMFTNRLAFMYRNLTYSYNMGKKLIPENLLRFNMYIKISDMRNFTRQSDDVNSDTLRTAIRDEYSRIIYELKDCEFFFPQSLNPSSLTMGGFNGINTDFASLQMKIKYRKVNRIFYSSLFDASNKKFLLSDKYYTPNINSNKTFLDSTKYSGDKTKKRDSTTNNIIKNVGLGEKLDTLKNRGLFINDNNDTAASKFVKTIGNQAVKAGAQVVSDGVQSLKNQINTKVGGSVRSFLQEKVSKKSIDLGYVNDKDKEVRVVSTNTSVQPSLNDVPEYVYNVNDSGTITNLAGIPSSEVYNYSSNTNPSSKIILDSNNPEYRSRNNDSGSVLVPGTSDAFTSSKYNYIFINPSEDLQPSTNFKFISPLENLQPSTNFKFTSPSENLQPSTTHKFESPSEDLQPSTNFKFVEPSEDLQPSTNFKFVEPSEDLQPSTNFKFVDPSENLYPNINNTIKNPKEDLSPDVNNVINDPIENLSPINKHSYVNPNEDINEDIKNNIQSPNENLGGGDNDIKHPNENVNGEIKSINNDPIDGNINTSTDNKMNDPSDNVNPSVNHKYIQPDKFPDLKSFKDYLKKNKGGDNI